MSAFYNVDQPPFNMGSVARAIAAANNGLLFDIGDMSTLYQDAAGTTPVTAVEQPVGLMLDKSRGLMLGPELVSNGTFDDASSWTAETGWSISGGVAVAASPNGTSIYQTCLIIGRTYKVKFTISGYVSGILKPFTGYSSGGVFYSSNGEYTSILKCTGDDKLYLQGLSFVGNIDNISVKELYGYHATQSITASRPTLSARKNILRATETLATQSVTTLAAQYTLSVTGTGSVTLSGAATGTLTGTGTDRASLTFTPTAGTLTLTVSGSVTNAQLELGASAGPYQRVNTETDYDTNPALFPKYLKFDGVDDYLNLPYMGLYANGSASVVAGINGHQYGKTLNGRILCESLVSSGAPTYAPLIQLNNMNTTHTYMTNDADTAFATRDILISQNSVSAISVIDSGASIKSYQNSSQKAASTYTRSGTVTLDSTTIGKGMNNGSTEIWLGDLYSLIITKSALTDAQRIKCERYAASKAGVIL